MLEHLTTSPRESGVSIRLERFADRFIELLRRLDPAPRPTPISLPFAFCFAFACLFTIWLLATNKYLPGQDVSYHAHCSRVWIDAGRAGSAYAQYEPAHPLEANTLLYTVSGVLSHLGSPFAAFRFVLAYYFLGLPVACLYALRALGRSPWGSLLAFPLCYTEVFAAGYANMAFAAPTFIFALVAYLRFTREPSLKRGVAVAVLFVATFLSHAHVYLWLGGLVTLYSLAILPQRIVSFASGTSARVRDLLALVFGAVAASAPSLVLFARWYARGYGAGNSIGGTGNNRPFASTMEWTPLAQKFQAGALQAFDATTSPDEPLYIVGLGLLVMFAMAMARAAKDRSAPLPELAIIVSVISFFVLPDGVALQMVAVRQWYFVYWLLPLVVVPIPLRFGPVRSLAVIAALSAWAVWRMSLVTEHLRRFTKEEMAGFDQIVAAAPREPGLMVAYAAVNARSSYWLTSPMYHSYGFLDAQRSYDGPIEYSDRRSVAPIRYKERPPLPLKHLYGNPNWPLDPGIWQYDLVLVYRWAPSAAQEKAAREHGTLVAAAGHWQLWRRLPQ